MTCDTLAEPGGTGESVSEKSQFPKQLSLAITTTYFHILLASF